MRAFQLQQCGLPDFEALETCSPAKYERYLTRLKANTVNLRMWHQVMGPWRGGRQLFPCCIFELACPP